MRRHVVLALVLILAAGTARAVSGHVEGYLPAAAHTPGVNGSFWSTDVWIYQQGATLVHLWFNPEGEDGTSTESVVVPLSDPVTHLADVVTTLFGRDEGVGSIHYLADGPVVVESRTFTTAPGGGSFGQTIPGIPIAGASIPGTSQSDALRMVVDQSSGFRSNLGLVNVSPVQTTAQVDVFTADGAPAPGSSSFTVDLPPFAMQQINDLLSRLDPGERAGLVVRVSVASEEGGLLAYLSTVDNTTNDPSYQEAFRLAY
jgi:hypothetical protein